MTTFLRHSLWGLACLIAVCVTGPAQAQVIKVKQAELEKVESAWLLNANFGIELPPGLENALKKGVTLHFLVQFELTRSRWYWFDEKAVNVQRQVRLSHQPLINQYRINAGGLALNASSLVEALRIAGTIGGWSVIEAAAIDADKQYEAALRMTLDLGKLPKPFQVDALNSRDWSLSGEWLRFPFNASMTSVSGRK
ncbi:MULTISPECIES: DUF4390 domain-containing protein [unclassified Polynucleobacter]|uniref:DUF4390 domain-containing protein n=1 Tax=unclassified Polynucleobacter TaxID=2640945 RepID=UPI002573DB20|nr:MULTISPECIES: DUF4390 domain-containing protein [unclassified Polynucleobacter]BEI36268.1 DUF4390 domain-containing protein [Polynucleobacter sp. HIN6]BEI41843.1 DUF4390 domain-containing protein [Polynucleobacter sp. HIN9]BEI43620.1 DUF4390 domain-containing protein [Polynucleobacter sp. HIN10]BEI45394.1 DUF4390 domain-containing protein [Polynucleobacter sp. HIN11]